MVRFIALMMRPRVVLTKNINISYVARWTAIEALGNQGWNWARYFAASKKVEG